MTLLAIMQTYRDGTELSSVLLSPASPSIPLKGTTKQFYPKKGTEVILIDRRRAAIVTSLADDARFFAGLSRGETTVAVIGSAEVKVGNSRQTAAFRAEVALTALPSAQPSVVPSASMRPTFPVTASPSDFLNGLPEHMEVTGACPRL